MRQPIVLGVIPTFICIGAEWAFFFGLGSWWLIVAVAEDAR